MQTALTVVGYAVGSYFGFPQLGAIVGAYVGGVLAAPDVQGPRISDTQVQGASYGSSIARVWGGDAIAGTLIWAGPMVEHATEESGKGGPTITTYSYTRSFAILIAEGRVEAIRRMWADTKLVLDYSGLEDHATQMASAATARYFVFYHGDETQMPDPTIESVEGVGLVEPYRGWAYIVFTDWPLGDFGNRIPLFRFELSNYTAATDADVAREPLVVYPWLLLGQFPSHSIGDTAWRNHVPAGGSTTYASFGDAVEATRVAGATSGDFWAPSAAYSDTYVDIYTDSVNPVYNREGGANAVADDAQYVWLRIAAEPPESFRIEMPDPSVGDDWLVLPIGVKTWVNYGLLHSGEVIAYRHPNYSVFGDAPPPISPAYQTTYAAGPLGGGMSFLVRGNPVLQVQGERVPTHRAKSCFPGDPCTAAEGMAELPGDEDWCITCDGDISPNYGWTIVAGTAKQLAGIEYRAGQLYQNGHGPVLLPGDPHYSDAAWWAARKAEAVAAGTMQADVTSPVVVSSYAERQPVDMFEVPPGQADLADVVRDICLDTGQLTADQIDVSELEHHVVLGYTRNRRAAARSVIDPLRVSYFFDALEDGDKIKFVMRGSPPVRMLTVDDIAAGLEQAEPEPLEHEHGQEEELPNSVDILYKSRAADYQQATQKAHRRAGGSTQQAGTELALVLDDNHAARIAEVMLFLSWVERNRRRVKTWRANADLQPTDVIGVDDGALTYVLRVQETSEQDGVIDLLTTDDDPAAYQSIATGAVPAGGGATMRIPGPTRFELLDIPLLRAEDDSAAPYVAARGYRPDWRGGRLLRSVDGGDSFSTYQDLQRVATLGHALTVLGDWLGGNMVDEANGVDVILIGGGTLASITRAELLNNGNGFALGDPAIGYEIGQFQRAELIADKTYRLTGLLRGRLGTERFMGTHAADDHFVLLTPQSLYRPPFEFANVGRPLQYKAISFGDLNAGAVVEFTNNAVALQPLAPVHLYVTPLASGGYRATWVRRTRYPAPWIDGVDVPLGEASESYLVRVLDTDGTVVETQTVATPEVTLGASVSGGPVLAPVRTYFNTGTDMRKVDASAHPVVGIAEFFGTSSFQRTARRWYEGGGPLEESADLGEILQACHGNDSLYAVGATYSGATYASVTLYRFDYADLTTPAATRACVDPAVLGFQGATFDGTDLWVVAQDVHELQRCNPDTLAVVDAYSFVGEQALRVFAAAGWLWLQLITTANTRLQRIDPADGSVVDSLPVRTFAGVFGLSDARVFVVEEHAVSQYDATTNPPTLLTSFTRTPTLQLTTAAVVGDLLAVGETGIGVIAGVHFFDMATGAYLGNTQASAAAYPAGERDGNLLAHHADISQTGEFALGDVAVTDLGGMTLEVAQLSATIGAGEAATAIIPGAAS